MRVLGIETSCDETGVALYDSDKGLLGHRLFSQIDLHANYGGVVPELASRDHIRRLLPLVHDLLADCQLGKEQLDGIAYTQGPGLVGALMVGACTGRALAFGLNIPAIGVNHMEGHLLAPMLEQHSPRFPFIALLVSGGHTQLVRADQIGEYTVLGESLDDAAGEAFDKVARMLGLAYPGGPEIAKLASRGRAGRFQFPRPMVDKPGLNFSFSGLKTFTLDTITRHTQGDGLPDRQTCADIAYAFQEAVIDTLIIKCARALQATQLTTLVIAGGVSANQHLRHQLPSTLQKIDATVFYARPEFCTDNGAMIAYAGYRRLLAAQRQNLSIAVKPRWPLGDLPAADRRKAEPPSPGDYGTG